MMQGVGTFDNSSAFPPPPHRHHHYRLYRHHRHHHHRHHGVRLTFQWRLVQEQEELMPVEHLRILRNVLYTFCFIIIIR